MHFQPFFAEFGWLKHGQSASIPCKQALDSTGPLVRQKDGSAFASWRGTRQENSMRPSPPLALPRHTVALYHPGLPVTPLPPHYTVQRYARQWSNHTHHALVPSPSPGTGKTFPPPAAKETSHQASLVVAGEDHGDAVHCKVGPTIQPSVSTIYSAATRIRQMHVLPSVHVHLETQEAAENAVR